MSIVVSVIEFWLGWQILDAVRDAIKAAWMRRKYRKFPNYIPEKVSR